jgi:hypothetical protein
LVVLALKVKQRLFTVDTELFFGDRIKIDGGLVPCGGRMFSRYQKFAFAKLEGRIRHNDAARMRTSNRAAPLLMPRSRKKGGCLGD